MSYRSIIPETTGGTPGHLLGAVKGKQVAAEPAVASLAAPELLHVEDLCLKWKRLGSLHRRGSAPLSGRQIQELLDEGDSDDMAASWPKLSKYATSLQQSEVSFGVGYTTSG